MTFVSPNDYTLHRATWFMRCDKLSTVIWPGQKYWKITAKFVIDRSGNRYHVGNISQKARTLEKLTSSYY